MRSMQEFFFLTGWDEMGHCVPNVFIFVTEKERNFIKDRKYCISSPLERERKKGNLAELTQVSCGLFSLLSKYF